MYYNHNNTGMPIDFARMVVIDDSNNKWIGTDSGLIRFDNTNWTLYDTTNSNLVSNDITSLKIDNTGLIWIGHDYGISTYDGQSWNNISLDSEFRDISMIAFENNNTYWFGSNHRVVGNPVGGLYRYNPNTGSFLKYNTSNSGLPHNFPFSMDFDSSGNKWIATLGGMGVAKFDGDTTWTVFDTNNSGIASNDVLFILVDDSNNKWFTTGNFSLTGNGISFYDNNTWTTYDTTNSSIISNTTFMIEIDNLNNKYFTTFNGVCIFNESGITNVQEKNTLPSAFKLSQNYPNPFNPTTMISYTLPTESKVKIEITNILGQSVGVLVNGNKSAGYYETTWNASNLPSGIYFISIKAEGLNSQNSFTQVKKALLLK